MYLYLFSATPLFKDCSLLLSFDIFFGKITVQCYSFFNTSLKYSIIVIKLD